MISRECIGGTFVETESPRKKIQFKKGKKVVNCPVNAEIGRETVIMYGMYIVGRHRVEWYVVFS